MGFVGRAALLGLFVGGLLAVGMGGPALASESETDASEATSYRVYVTNETDKTFDRVMLAYKRVGEDATVVKRTSMGARETIVFSLGACNRMERYILAFFRNGKLVGRLPAVGEGITPKEVGEMFPDDTDPCVDRWSVSPASGPDGS